MTYLEALPDQCPPNDADDVALIRVYRMVNENPPAADDFKSYAALGKENKHGSNPCGWASCSLVYNPEAHKSRWPKLREATVKFARLDIPEGTGKSKSKKNSNHIHFWCYSTSNMHSFVQEVIELPAENDNG